MSLNRIARAYRRLTSPFGEVGLQAQRAAEFSPNAATNTRGGF